MRITQAPCGRAIFRCGLGSVCWHGKNGKWKPPYLEALRECVFYDFGIVIQNGERKEE